MSVLSTTLRDVALTAAHDWDLSSGTFAFVSGIDGVAQAINYAIQMHKGEWFMDLTQGIPYLVRPGVLASEALLGQKDANINQRAIAAYSVVILGVESVKSITSISASLTGRTLSVAWTVGVQFDDLASTTSVSGTTLVQR